MHDLRVSMCLHVSPREIERGRSNVTDRTYLCRTLGRPDLDQLDGSAWRSSSSVE